MRATLILWRYICAEYLRWFAMCLFGFTSLAVVVDLIEKSRNLLKYKASFSEVMRYTAYQLPEFLYMMLPFSALFALLIALAGMGRRNEVTAMLAGGVGRRSIVLPMALLALLSSAAQFGLAEYVVPESNVQKRYVWDVQIRGKDTAKVRDRRNKWFYADGGFLNAAVLDPGKQMISGLLYIKPGDGERPPTRIEAATAQWEGETREWRLREVRETVVDSAGHLAIVRSPTAVLPVSLSPEDLAGKARKPEEWSAQDLRQIIRDRTRLGQDVLKERVELYSRYALPLAGFVMALLGAPFAFREHRRGGAAVGFLTGVVIAFSYVAVLYFFKALGSAGSLPAELAAWLPNLVFGVAGVYLAANLDAM